LVLYGKPSLGSLISLPQANLSRTRPRKERHPFVLLTAVKYRDGVVRAIVLEYEDEATFSIALRLRWEMLLAVHENGVLLIVIEMVTLISENVIRIQKVEVCH
jgi:hypothetical protein